MVIGVTRWFLRSLPSNFASPNTGQIFPAILFSMIALQDFVMSTLVYVDRRV